ncbi:MAG: polysaccharide pyruvyl transferase family protein [Candidatus Bathyarchaeia archaeon]
MIENKNVKIEKPRILIIDVCNPLSMGGAAITLVLIEYLRKNFPDAKITLMTSRKRDQEIYIGKYDMRDVDFIPHMWYREKSSTLKTLFYSFIPAILAVLRIIPRRFFRGSRIRSEDALSNYDVIIDLNSDAINEHYGIVFPLFTLFNIFIASLSNKPVIISPCTIGSFRKPFMNSIAKFVLNRASLIMVRENISWKNLEKLGVPKHKISLGGDLAFLLQPKQINADDFTEIDLTKIERPMIGLAPSQEICRYAFIQRSKNPEEKYKMYVKLMSEIADFMIERFDASVILIPHSLSDEESPRYKLLDDRIACQSVYDGIKNKGKVWFIRGHHRTDEIKALIGKCDLFVGCRMHSTIASTSMLVPTIALAYGEKFEGIISDLMGQRDYVINVSEDYNVLLERIKSRIVDLWTKKDFVRKDLQERLENIQKIVNSSLFAISRAIEGKEVF